MLLSTSTRAAGPKSVSNSCSKQVPFSSAKGPRSHNSKSSRRIAAQAVAAPPAPVHAGHTQLLHGLGSVGDVAPSHMPWLLRLAHIRANQAGGDSSQALQVRGGPVTWMEVCMWPLQRMLTSALPFDLWPRALLVCTISSFWSMLIATVHNAARLAAVHNQHVCAGVLFHVCTAPMHIIENVHVSVQTAEAR